MQLIQLVKSFKFCIINPIGGNEIAIDNLRISHNASGMGANIWVLVTYRSKRSIYTLKIFYFRYNSRAETRAKLKTVLYFVKLIMQKVSYIPLENILADDPLPRMSKKG